MIARLSGTVVAVFDRTAVVDVSGIGYEVELGPIQIGRLNVGESVVLWIRTLMRNESISLYGFFFPEERDLFDGLLKVQGVGPALALAILATLGLEGCLQAVAGQDIASLCSVPGVGEKTAKRIVVDLASFAQSRSFIRPVQVDLIDALRSLGFSTSEIDRVMPSVPDGLALEDAIRLALKEMSQ